MKTTLVVLTTLTFAWIAIPLLADATDTAPIKKTVRFAPPADTTHKTVDRLLGEKLHNVLQAITTALKSGKLDKARAKALRTQVMEVRRKESGFMRQNSDHRLTSAQRDELSGKLDAIASSI